MRDFTKYDIWINGIDFIVDIYQKTQDFPSEEKFGWTSQIRRASVSISSNFAEGCSRSSEKEFSRFLEISLGSAFEVKTQLMIANRLEILKAGDFSKSVSELDLISKQINALRNKLKN